MVFFERLAPTMIGIEASGASHHWARLFRSFGHDVKLIPAQLVKPYVKAARTIRLKGGMLGRLITAYVGLCFGGRPKGNFLTSFRSAPDDRSRSSALRRLSASARLF